MSVRLGIVGVGGVGRLIGPGARAARGLDAAACASGNVANAERYAAEHGIPRVHSSLEAMLADDTIDAVFLGTPSGLHAEQTLAALDAGKHVLVEKPMALSLADATAMTERAEALGLVLGVGFHLRHHDVLQELKRLLDAGDIGRPLLVRASWGMPITSILTGWKRDPRMAGAGAWMGFGVHALDIVLWLLGSEPSRLVAASDATPEQLDRTFAALLEFDGCLADIQVSRRFEFRPNGVVVHGEEGVLYAPDALTVRTEGTLMSEDGTVLAEAARDPYRVQLEAFAAAVRGEAPFHADGRDGMRIVALTEALITTTGAHTP